MKTRLEIIEEEIKETQELLLRAFVERDIAEIMQETKDVIEDTHNTIKLLGRRKKALEQLCEKEKNNPQKYEYFPAHIIIKPVAA